MIRAGTAADAESITEVFLASRTTAMPWLPRLHSDVETRDWITHVVLPTCRTWVAVDPASGAVTGFAALAGDELEHLYVRPDLLGRGIGTALLARVEQASPGGLSLRVFERNTAARAFYERHGFRPVDADDGSRNEENEPDATYRRP